MSVNLMTTQGYVKPSGAIWSVPTTPMTPSIIILNNGFSSIVGFEPATYPAQNQSSIYSVYSNFTPQEKVVSSILVSCSLVNSPFSIPSNIIYSFAPEATEFGAIISSHAFNFAWSDIVNNNYSSFTIKFMDQDFNNIQILDTSMVVTLVLRKKPLHE